MATRIPKPTEAAPVPQATEKITDSGRALPEDQVGGRVIFKEPFSSQGKRRKGPCRPIASPDNDPLRFFE